MLTAVMRCSKCGMDVTNPQAIEVRELKCLVCIMGPLPVVHPREAFIRRATQSLAEVIEYLRESHQLTYAETFAVVLGCANDLAKDVVVIERRKDEKA